MSEPVAIEPISRALRILEILNLRRLTSIEMLHQECGLPKSTLVRLVQALVAAGYVEQVSRAAGYRLTAKVQALSAGFRPRDRLIDIARPKMDGFTARYKWPVYLATPEDLTMHIRYSTSPQSPVAPDVSAGYHHRLSMLVSALGKAYLAFCPRRERDILIRPLLGKPDFLDGEVRTRTDVDLALADVRRKGYAVTAPVFGDRGRGLAVPLRSGRRAVGAITMRHFRSSLTEEAAVAEYLQPLQKMAAEIVAGWRKDAPTTDATF